MNIPTTVRNYLARKGGQYKVHAATAGLSLADAVRAARVPVQKLVRSAVLKDGSSYLMAVYPATHRLDLTVLNVNSRRNFAACSADELKTLLADSENVALPPRTNWTRCSLPPVSATCSCVPGRKTSPASPQGHCAAIASPSR